MCLLLAHSRDNDRCASADQLGFLTTAHRANDDADRLFFLGSAAHPALCLWVRTYLFATPLGRAGPAARGFPRWSDLASARVLLAPKWAREHLFVPVKGSPAVVCALPGRPCHLSRLGLGAHNSAALRGAVSPST